MNSNNRYDVPKATMQRYPVYLKALRKLQSMGVERILSRELSLFVDIESTTIRRDFSFIGSLGKQGYGYDVETLINTFDELLGVSFDEKIVLVGAGNLGRAILNYNRWNHVVGEIVCAFDVDPNKLGEVSDIPIYHMSELALRMPEGCRIAILTVSKNVQETVDKLVEHGVVGIVDFSSEHIQVPKHVIVKTVDVVSTIQELIFQTNSFR
ncbi:CoA-binding protein [Erysipelothrix larvae]|uniref:Redox-sensing transcriptional repressor Rex n=1 Tax=Erysipelothrix larvae TaxID=1514105 RepID=A0A0X8GZ28_9FIRM|nr:redox-sensing transcriptional repressor Rex [Erysipelothrix larvae]AMC93057.1 CoA-binding protein [Erysipelothrix larvae]